MGMTHEVTISPKFQIVIPKDIREKYGFKAGQRVVWMEWMGSLRLVPHRELTDLIGILPRDIDSTIESEPDREL
jgi:AbrB family looped-hinge helix DNA binding protein